MAKYNVSLGFELDTNKLDRAIRDISARMKELQTKGTINGLQITKEQQSEYIARMIELRDAVNKMFTAKKFDLLPTMDKAKEAEFSSIIEKASIKLNRLNSDLGNNSLMANKAIATQSKLAEEFRKGTEAVDPFDQALNKVTKSFQAIAMFSIAQFGFRGLTGTITDAIDHVKDLDKSLTEIRVVTGVTASELKKYAEEYNKMAREFGNTTKEIADTASLFYRQGRDQAEAMKMTEAVVKGARVSGESLVEVTDKMTAVINGFQLSGEQAMSVMDKFAILDAAMATSFKEMSYAMTKVASQAYNANIELDQMLGMISTISSVTREAPENIGTGLKTMIARMRGITDEGFVTDESIMELNKVDKALKQIGISQYDMAGEMKNSYVVLDELGAKWYTLDKSMQSYIATAVAGSRQTSRFFAMMNDWTQVTNATSLAMNSAGAANIQFARAQEGLETQLAKTRAELERLYSILVDGSTIKSANSLFQNLLKTINNILQVTSPTTIGLLGLNRILANFVKTRLDKLDFSKFFNNSSSAAKALAKDIKNLQTELRTIEVKGKIPLFKQATYTHVDEKTGREEERKLQNQNKLIISQKQYNSLTEKQKQQYDDMLKNLENINQGLLDALKHQKNIIPEIERQLDIARDTNASDEDRIKALQEIAVLTNKNLTDAKQRLELEIANSSSAVERAALNAELDEVNERILETQQDINNITDEEIDKAKEKLRIAKEEAELQVKKTQSKQQDVISDGKSLVTQIRMADLFKKMASEMLSLVVTLAASTKLYKDALENAADRFEAESARAQYKQQVAGATGGAVGTIGGAALEIFLPGVGKILSPIMGQLGTVIGTWITKGAQERINREKELYEDLYKTFDEYTEQTTKLKELRKELHEVAPEFGILQKGVSDVGKNLRLTNEQYSQYINYSNRIAEILPELITGYDDQGNAIINANERIDDYTDALKRQEDELNKMISARKGELLATAGRDIAYEMYLSDRMMKARGAKIDYSSLDKALYEGGGALGGAALAGGLATAGMAVGKTFMFAPEPTMISKIIGGVLIGLSAAGGAYAGYQQGKSAMEASAKQKYIQEDLQAYRNVMMSEEDYKKVDKRLDQIVEKNTALSKAQDANDINRIAKLTLEIKELEKRNTETFEYWKLNERLVAQSEKRAALIAKQTLGQSYDISIATLDKDLKDRYNELDELQQNQLKSFIEQYNFGDIVVKMQEQLTAAAQARGEDVDTVDFRKAVMEEAVTVLDAYQEELMETLIKDPKLMTDILNIQNDIVKQLNVEGAHIGEYLTAAEDLDQRRIDLLDSITDPQIKAWISDVMDTSVVTEKMVKLSEQLHEWGLNVKSLTNVKITRDATQGIYNLTTAYEKMQPAIDETKARTEDFGSALHDFIKTGPADIIETLVEQFALLGSTDDPIIVNEILLHLTDTFKNLDDTFLSAEGPRALNDMFKEVIVNTDTMRRTFFNLANELKTQFEGMDKLFGFVDKVSDTGYIGVFDAMEMIMQYPEMISNLTVDTTGQLVLGFDNLGQQLNEGWKEASEAISTWADEIVTAEEHLRAKTIIGQAALIFEDTKQFAGWEDYYSALQDISDPEQIERLISLTGVSSLEEFQNILTQYGGSFREAMNELMGQSEDEVKTSIALMISEWKDGLYEMERASKVIEIFTPERIYSEKLATYNQELKDLNRTLRDTKWSLDDATRTLKDYTEAWTDVFGIVHETPYEIEKIEKAWQRAQKAWNKAPETLAKAEKQFVKTMKKLAEDEIILDLQFSIDMKSFDITPITNKIDMLKLSIEFLSDESPAQAMEYYNQILDATIEKSTLLSDEAARLSNLTANSGAEAKLLGDELENVAKSMMDNYKQGLDARRKIQELQREQIEKIQKEQEDAVKKQIDIEKELISVRQQAIQDADYNMNRLNKSIDDSLRRLQEGSWSRGLSGQLMSYTIFERPDKLEKKDPVKAKQIENKLLSDEERKHQEELLKIYEAYLIQVNAFKKQAAQEAYKTSKEELEESRQSAKEAIEAAKEAYQDAREAFIEAERSYTKAMEDVERTIIKTKESIEDFNETIKRLEEIQIPQVLKKIEEIHEAMFQASLISSTFAFTEEQMESTLNFMDTFSQNFTDRQDEMMEYWLTEAADNEYMRDFLSTIMDMSEAEMETFLEEKGARNIGVILFESLDMLNKDHISETAKQSIRTAFEALSKFMETGEYDTFKTEIELEYDSLPITAKNMYKLLIKELDIHIEEQKTRQDTALNELVEKTGTTREEMIKLLNDISIGIADPNANEWSDIINDTINKLKVDPIVFPIDFSFPGLEDVGGNYKGTDKLKQYYSGTKGTPDDGLSMTGELGREVAVLPNGNMTVLGQNGPEMSYLPKGTVIYNHNDTEKILNYIKDPEQNSVKDYFSQLNAYADGTSSFVYPVQDPYMVTSKFGSRKDPFTGKTASHTGLDIASIGGKKVPIYAALGGTVVANNYDASAGNYLRIDHGNGIQTQYQHMNALSPFPNGTPIKQGQNIGIMGTTGRSTGVHLHFEVLQGNTKVNPEPYLNNTISLQETQIDVNTMMDDFKKRIKETLASIFKTMTTTSSTIQSVNTTVANAISSMSSSSSNKIKEEVRKLMNIAARGTTPLSAYSSGTSGTPRTEPALVGEFGPEWAVLPNGDIKLLGKNGPEIAKLPKGTIVYDTNTSSMINDYIPNIENKKLSTYANGTNNNPAVQVNNQPITRNYPEEIYKLLDEIITVRPIFDHITWDLFVANIRNGVDVLKEIELNINSILNIAMNDPKLIELIRTNSSLEVIADLINRLPTVITSGNTILNESIHDLMMQGVDKRYEAYVNELEQVVAGTKGIDISSLSEEVKDGITGIDFDTEKLTEVKEAVKETNNKVDETNIRVDESNKQLNLLNQALSDIKQDMAKLAKARTDLDKQEKQYFDLKRAETFSGNVADFGFAISENKIVQEVIEYLTKEWLSEKELETLAAIRSDESLSDRAKQEKEEEFFKQRRQQFLNMANSVGDDFEQFVEYAYLLYGSTTKEAVEKWGELNQKYMEQYGISLLGISTEAINQAQQTEIRLEKQHNLLYETAKQSVIKDIDRYYNAKAGLISDLYQAAVSTTPEKKDFITGLTSREAFDQKATGFEVLSKLIEGFDKIDPEKTAQHLDDIITNKYVRQSAELAYNKGQSFWGPGGQMQWGELTTADESTRKGWETAKASLEALNVLDDTQTKQLAKYNELIAADDVKIKQQQNILDIAAYNNELYRQALGEDFDLAKYGATISEDIYKIYEELGGKGAQTVIDMVKLSEALKLQDASAEDIEAVMKGASAEATKYAKIIAGTGTQEEKRLQLQKEMSHDLYTYQMETAMALQEFKIVTSEMEIKTYQEQLERDKARLAGLQAAADLAGGLTENQITEWENLRKNISDAEDAIVSLDDAIQSAMSAKFVMGYEYTFKRLREEVERLNREYERTIKLNDSLRRGTNALYALQTSKDKLTRTDNLLAVRQAELEAEKEWLALAEYHTPEWYEQLDKVAAKEDEINDLMVEHNDLVYQILADGWMVVEKVLGRVKENMENINFEMNAADTIADLEILLMDLQELQGIVDMSALNYQADIPSTIAAVSDAIDITNMMVDMNKKRIEDERIVRDYKLQTQNLDRTNIDDLKIIEELNSKINEQLQESAATYQFMAEQEQKVVQLLKVQYNEVKKQQVASKKAYDALIKQKEDEIAALEEAKKQDKEANDLLKAKLELLKALDDVSHAYITGAGIEIMRPDVEKVAEARSRVEELQASAFDPLQDAIDRLKDELAALKEEDSKKQTEFGKQLEGLGAQISAYEQGISTWQTWADDLASKWEDIVYGISDAELKSLEEFWKAQLGFMDTNNKEHVDALTAFKESMTKWAESTIDLTKKEMTTISMGMSEVITAGKKAYETNIKTLDGDLEKLKGILEDDFTKGVQSFKNSIDDWAKEMGKIFGPEGAFENDVLNPFETNLQKLFDAFVDKLNSIKFMYDTPGDKTAGGVTGEGRTPSTTDNIPTTPAPEPVKNEPKAPTAPVEPAKPETDSDKIKKTNEMFAGGGSSSESFGDYIRKQYPDKTLGNDEIRAIIEKMVATGNFGHYYIGNTKYTDSNLNKILAAYDAGTLRTVWSTDRQKSGYMLPRFNTGGYTGEWGPNPRWGLVDEKELILNQKDTGNLLKVISLLRELESSTGTSTLDQNNVRYLVEMSDSIKDLLATTEKQPLTYTDTLRLFKLMDSLNDFNEDILYLGQNDTMNLSKMLNIVFGMEASQIDLYNEYSNNSFLSQEAEVIRQKYLENIAATLGIDIVSNIDSIKTSIDDLIDVMEKKDTSNKIFIDRIELPNVNEPSQFVDELSQIARSLTNGS